MITNIAGAPTPTIGNIITCFDASAVVADAFAGDSFFPVYRWAPCVVDHPVERGRERFRKVAVDTAGDLVGVANPLVNQVDGSFGVNRCVELVDLDVVGIVAQDDARLAAADAGAGAAGLGDDLAVAIERADGGAGGDQAFVVPAAELDLGATAHQRDAAPGLGQEEGPADREAPAPRPARGAGPGADRVQQAAAVDAHRACARCRRPGTAWAAGRRGRR